MKFPNHDNFLIKQFVRLFFLFFVGFSLLFVGFSLIETPQLSNDTLFFMPEEVTNYGKIQSFIKIWKLFNYIINTYTVLFLLIYFLIYYFNLNTKLVQQINVTLGDFKTLDNFTLKILFVVILFLFKKIIILYIIWFVFVYQLFVVYWGCVIFYYFITKKKKIIELSLEHYSLFPSSVIQAFYFLYLKIINTYALLHIYYFFSKNKFKKKENFNIWITTVLNKVLGFPLWFLNVSIGVVRLLSDPFYYTNWKDKKKRFWINIYFWEIKRNGVFRIYVKKSDFFTYIKYKKIIISDRTIKTNK